MATRAWKMCQEVRCRQDMRGCPACGRPDEATEQSHSLRGDGGVSDRSAAAEKKRGSGGEGGEREERVG